MSRIQDAIHRYVACRAILDHGVSVFAVGDPAGAQLNAAIRRALFLLGEDRSAVWVTCSSQRMPSAGGG